MQQAVIAQSTLHGSKVGRIIEMGQRVAKGTMH
jgi:hypothetical protein